MAVPRGKSESIRGTLPKSTPSRQRRPRPELVPNEPIADPFEPRDVVEFALTKRRALATLVTTATGASDHLDPHPNLLRAARNHGVPAGEPCPWCKSESALTTLNFVYGDELGPFEGRIKNQAQLMEMAQVHGRFRVYHVEVCAECGWNHLNRHYVLGDGVSRPALRAPNDALE